MKGILKKTKEGWFVIFDQRNMQDPSAENGILPLHPLDVKMIDEDSKVFDHIETRIKAYPNVEFEINMYDGKSNISNAWNGYAKLIDHIVDINKMVSSQTEISDESWEGCDGCTEQDEVMYKNGYVKGYNSAISELPKEISDEEIEKEANNTYVKYNDYAIEGFIDGAKWYRGQLKQRQ